MGFKEFLNETLNGFGVAKIHNVEYAKNNEPTNLNDLIGAQYKGEIYKDKETAKKEADKENSKVHKPSQGLPVIRFIAVEVKNNKIIK